jgi:hypothetical protein
MKIYDYEQFIPGGTNNLHFIDIRHPFLVTSNIIIFTIYVMTLPAHSTTSPTPTAMGQSFIMTLYIYIIQEMKSVFANDKSP